MIAWDFSDFTKIGRVHHLTVLCYYLQHPSHYSTQGLKVAINTLKKAVEMNLSDKDLYREESDIFSSTNRNWKVTGTSFDHGTYDAPIRWTRTVYSVVKDGMEAYPEQIKEWAKQIYEDLRNAGEIS
jgi:hypothetical protein